MKKTFSGTMLCAALLASVLASGRLRASDIDFSFLTTLGYTTLDRDSDINTNFRGDDPFNPVRVMAFAESWIHPRLGIFMEFLWDQGEYHSGSDTKPRVNGAYAVAKPWDSDKLLFKIGLIPWNIGTWAPRTYADRNPLVGLPLMYHYRSPFSASSLPATYEQMYDRAGDRGLPLIYETCWPLGITAFGFLGEFQYFLTVSKESPANPRAFTNRGGNLSGRLAWEPSPAFTLGGSFSVGHYLSAGEIALPAGTQSHEPLQKIIGLDARFSRGWTEIQSEVIRNWFGNPFLDKDIGCNSGYVELKQKLSAGLYFAIRYNRLAYDGYTTESGEDFTWGYNLTRIETGMGYHFYKGILLKLVWQHNNFEDEGEDADLLNTQFVLTF